MKVSNNFAAFQNINIDLWVIGRHLFFCDFLGRRVVRRRLHGRRRRSSCLDAFAIYELSNLRLFARSPLSTQRPAPESPINRHRGAGLINGPNASEVHDSCPSIEHRHIPRDPLALRGTKEPDCPWTKLARLHGSLDGFKKLLPILVFSLRAEPNAAFLEHVFEKGLLVLDSKAHSRDGGISSRSAHDGFSPKYSRSTMASISASQQDTSAAGSAALASRHFWTRAAMASRSASEARGTGRRSM